jgi:hypothetical protein
MPPRSSAFEGITGEDAANRTHHQVVRAGRRFIIEELEGVPPEQLPTPAQSIQDVQRAQQRSIERERQSLLFGGDADGDA